MNQNRSQEPDDAAPGAPTPQSPADRLLRLETQVATLAEAIRALAHGLESLPSQDITHDEEEAARGARLAHELLLSQGL